VRHPVKRNGAEDLANSLRQLRLILSGLQMGGVCDWHSYSATEIRLPPEEVRIGIDNQSSNEHLSQIQQDLEGCRRCRLHSDRKNLVFGEGSPRARLVFVGEGPGFDEDQQGRPFVGRAGKLLDKMITTLELKRDAVYICNVVKCRPPGNRTPSPDEIEICSTFLTRQLQALQPEVICALGACAAQTLLGSSRSISNLRSKVQSWQGIPLVCTFHPAYLLRNSAQKAAVWQDLLEVQRILQSYRKGKQ
jgi:uracil-DNA glycosylase